MELLTVCINTRNRQEYIIEFLDLYKNFFVENKISLVIYDCSDSFLEIFGCTVVKHVKGDEGIGLDEGYVKAFKLAKSRYVWFLSDDDLLNVREITNVLKLLQQGNFDLLLLNAEVWTKGFKFKLSTSLMVDGDDRHSWARLLSFIGSIVVRSDFYNDCINTKEFGSMFHHVHALASVHTSRVIVYERPVIRIRAGNMRWSKDAFKIWTYEWPRALNSFCGNSDYNHKSPSMKIIYYYYVLGALSSSDTKFFSKSRFNLFPNNKLIWYLYKAVLLLLLTFKNGYKNLEPFYYILISKFKSNDLQK